MKEHMINLETLKHSCKKTRRLVTFILVVVSIIAFVNLFMLILIYLLPSGVKLNWHEYAPAIVMTFKGEPYQLTLSSSKLTHELNNVQTAAAALAFSNLLFYMCTCFIFLTVRALLTNIINEYSPFIQKNLRYLRILAFLILYIGVGNEIVQTTLLHMTGNGVWTYFNESNTPYAFLMLFLMAIVFSFEKIFSYGCHLQTEYDETL